MSGCAAVAIAQWHVATEKKVLELLLPIVGKIHGELVLEEVDVGSLVLPLAEKVLPVQVGDLCRGRRPWLQVLDADLVQVIQLGLIGAEQVCRAEEVGGLVHRAQMVVDDGVVDVVGLEEVLEASGSSARVRLDLVDLDWWEVDCLLPRARSDEPVGYGDIREEARHLSGAGWRRRVSEPLAC
ncbi:hypothetical protein VFPBJ_04486 [Purpureocillium lilacinum]|uniref:Uncharacterized protein n=1 Tax=Purpureocillium lilacinum TaxID=33203 RepID=A0A179GVX4_PURLI|nr:hypothetical protein VFPBJ_04486 [Purpureocillium lilacinum]